MKAPDRVTHQPEHRPSPERLAGIARLSGGLVAVDGTHVYLLTRSGRLRLSVCRGDGTALARLATEAMRMDAPQSGGEP